MYMLEAHGITAVVFISIIILIIAVVVPVMRGQARNPGWLRRCPVQPGSYLYYPAVGGAYRVTRVWHSRLTGLRRFSLLPVSASGTGAIGVPWTLPGSEFRHFRRQVGKSWDGYPDTSLQPGTTRRRRRSAPPAVPGNARPAAVAIAPAAPVPQPAVTGATVATATSQAWRQSLAARPHASSADPHRPLLEEVLRTCGYSQRNVRAALQACPSAPDAPILERLLPAARMLDRVADNEPINRALRERLRERLEAVLRAQPNLDSLDLLDLEGDGHGLK